ncbi:release factor glutamine methyltransferase [Actinoalloteichus hoggarensis]|uniref:peptide chain release factor N(5)-glutamine methyltransferase n=1 Tax=Actinoalloteichus hoggarensis TaxID=1470176 RepID=A0A221W3Z0_9PSEU|nr:putative protein N(5)-glutamine methyltransferase [Actinoalloteichus hoggarensis]ASO20528.1 50S ribosomal protein L3 glutamine methyltransferase [Actinoalloteichus hoggarensis]MBB5923568.1 release factor glutamine methyltransferase [Actinoalloteichus hoggarensis]
MSASSTSATHASITTRLRAAGCVYAEDEAHLLVSAAVTSADLTAMVERRAAGLPLEHILGWAEFHGRRIAVDPGVFVPRRRTEFLVDQALRLAHDNRRHVTPPPVPVIVDLCCGSGAVGAALLAVLDQAELHAVDVEPAAVACARRNLTEAGGHVHHGDLYTPLPSTLLGRVDILVANVPYVPTEEIDLLPPEARLHEPRTALDGGADGLDVLRQVAAAAPHWLAARGALLIETSGRQLPRAVTAFTDHGLVPEVATSDDGHATVVIGRPARTPLRTAGTTRPPTNPRRDEPRHT